MTSPAMQGQDASDGQRRAPYANAGNQAMTLTWAVQAVARDAGFEIDPDDLNAALGLSWMVSAVPGEDDLARWPMYARDAFLVEAGRLFGMGIRDVHPPEAARGLYGAAGFKQHFDASYRPLILRALENGQPVLAWRGWPGEREMYWGVITRPSDQGVGLAGVIPLPGASIGSGDELILENPPVQLYVVETITPTQPDPNELLDLALEHACQVLDNVLVDRFGVLTGVAAYDAWIARLRGEPKSDAAPHDLTPGHRQMAASVLAGHHSAIRFLKRHLTQSTPATRSLTETLADKCQKIVTAASEALDAAVDDAWVSTPFGRAAVTDPIARARDAANEMLTLLESHAHRKKSRQQSKLGGKT